MAKKMMKGGNDVKKLEQNTNMVVKMPKAKPK